MTASRPAAPTPAAPVPGRVLGGAELLRSVGLLADGPVTWGRPVASGRPGVYVVEWPESRPDAPVDLAVVGKWIERLPGLRLDGARPTSRGLAARLHDFWLPGQVVVYVGMTTSSIGARVAAFYRTPLGDRRPHAGGQWLKTLRGLERARVWWAETNAPEEYEDGIFGAFAATIDASAAAAPRLADREVILPFANLQTAMGVRKAHGISGSVEPREEEAAAPERRIVEVPDGDADGAAESARGRPLEPHRPAASAPPRGSGAAPTGRTPDDVASINDLLQEVACRRLLRELSVADAAAELSTRGFLRGTRAQPVAVLRELLKNGRIEGAVQDTDRRWAIRCVREGGR